MLTFEQFEDRRLLAVQAFPTPLESMGPSGSLMYGGTAGGTIGGREDEVATFLIDLDADQSLTLVADTEDAIQPWIAVLDARGVLLDWNHAPSLGEPAHLQNVPITRSGQHSIRVFDLGAAGSFTLDVLLNAAVDESGLGIGPANDSAATAQGIDGSFLAIGGGSAERGGVVGAGQGSDEYFRFTVDDSETLSIGMASDSNASTAIDLIAPDGSTVLATGIAAANLTGAIANYVDDASTVGAEDYFVRVRGADGGYSLVVTRGIDFDHEPNNNIDNAQDITPARGALGFVKGDSTLFTNSTSPPATDTGLPIAEAVLEAPIPILETFPGPDFTGSIPPDPTLAAGPEQVVAMVNTQIAIYDKQTGSELFSQSLDGESGFFGEVGATTAVFDPWVFFDPDTERFFAIGIDIASDAESNLFLAVSTDATPTSGSDWHKYKLDFTANDPLLGAGAHFPDYPKAGVNSDAILISGNYFPIVGGSGVYAGLTAIEKTPLLSGDPVNILYEEFFDGFSVFPVIQYDAGTSFYLAEAFTDGGSSIVIHEVSNLSREPTRTTSSVTVPGYEFPAPIPQQGGATADAIDARILSGVLRDGSLWVAQAIQDPAIGDGEAVSRWYEFDVTGAPTLVQSGNVDPGPGVHAWMPALSVDGAHNMAIGFALGGPNQFFGAGFTGRLADDPIGETSLPITEYALGLGNYDATGVGGVNRWGDYSGLAIDPADDATFWVFNEYATDTNTWNTQIASFQLEAPTDEDWFRLAVNEGDQLAISVDLPGGKGFGEFVNLLGEGRGGPFVQVELYDPAGALVAGDSSSIAYTATQAGDHRVRVSAIAEQGEYVISVLGATGAESAPAIVDLDPDPGTTIAEFPTTLTVDFSEGLRVPSVEASDLLFGGRPALGVRPVDGDTFEFTIDPAANSGDGSYFIVMDAGAVTDLQGQPSQAFLDTLTLDTTGPVILSTFWNQRSPGRTLSPGSLTFEAIFNEDLYQLGSARRGPFAPSVDDVDLWNSVTGESFAPKSTNYDADSDRFRAEFEALPEGLYTLTLRSGDSAFEDAVGNDLDGEPLGPGLDGAPTGDGVVGGDYTVNLSVDAVAPRELNPFFRQAPVGGLVLSSLNNLGVVNHAGDTDEFTFPTYAGHSVAVILTPTDPSATLSMEIVGVGGPVVADQAGGPVYLPPAQLTTNGVGTIRVSGDAPTAFTLELLLNATAERFVGDTSESATMSVNDSYVRVGSGRFAVVGTSDTIPVGPGRLFALPGDGTNSIVELDPVDGTETNRFAAPIRLALADNGLAFDGERLFFLSSVSGGLLYELDPDTGVVMDSDTIPGGSGRYGGLAAIDGTIFLSDLNAQDLFNFDPETDTVLQVFDFDALNSGAALLGAMAGIVNPAALVATLSSGDVVEIDPATGQVVNSFPSASGTFDAGAAVLGEEIYVGALAGGDEINVYRRDGSWVRTFALPYPVSALGGDATRPAATLTDESNDTISLAVESRVGPGESSYYGLGSIGDNQNLEVAGLDVDLIRLEAAAGELITVDIDASDIGSSLDPILTLFDPRGRILAQNDDATSVDSLLEYTPQRGGTFYVGVSGFSNFDYDPLVEGSGTPGATGFYELLVAVGTPPSGGNPDANVAERAVSDVDAYTLDTTGLAGARLDIVLAGHGFADLSGQSLRLLDANGATVVESGAAAPLGVEAENYDLAILGFVVPANQESYTIRVESDVASDYTLLVTEDLLFESQPNSVPGNPLRTLIDGLPALGAIGLRTGGIQFTDPEGDVFGSGTLQPDIASLSASVSSSELILEATFFNDIAPFSSGRPEGIVGFWDLDLDQDPGTGGASTQSIFAPPAQQGGALGVEARIAFHTEVGGIVSIEDGVTGLPRGTASIRFTDRSLVVSVPLDVLGDEGELNYGAVFGTSPEPTDAAPDTLAGSTFGVALAQPAKLASLGTHAWPHIAASGEGERKSEVLGHPAVATAYLPIGVSRADLARQLRRDTEPDTKVPPPDFRSLIVSSEIESNDSIATATPLPLGFDPDEDTEVDVNGSLGSAIPPVTVFPTEDDGAIPLASLHLLNTGESLVARGTIGDGPFGATSGDYDWYGLRRIGAGDLITVDIDASSIGSPLDSYLGIYDATGALLISNDDADGVDSFLDFSAPSAGNYYVVVRGFGGDFQSDPFDSSSGTGEASTGDYEIAIGRNVGDVDYFEIALAAGDILGANVTGGAQRLRLFDALGTELIGTSQSSASIYPASSPLPRGGNANLSWVVDTEGPYYVATSMGTGAYDLQLRLFRPELEGQVEGAHQILFLDFDGATVETNLFGGVGTANLSPLADFLPGWGIALDDEDATIDAIVAAVEENLSLDLRTRGLNGDYDDTGVPGQFDIEIRNSRDHGDPFGLNNVSRVIVGGTVAELGISTIGIAQSIDVGNFDTEETAVVLLDLLSAPASDPNSLNQFVLGPSVSIIELVGVGVGNIAAHEAGHFLAAWHTDQFNAQANIMDQGGNLPGMIGLTGGVWGDGDEIDVDFARDTFVPNEGFTGMQNSLNAIAFGLSTGTLDPALVGPTVTLIDPPAGDVEDLNITTIRIDFSEPITRDSATAPASYSLLEAGLNGLFEAGHGDDVTIPIAPQPVRDNGVELILGDGLTPLRLGNYQLTIDGDSSIADLDGNPLNSTSGPQGGADHVHEFQVVFNFPVGGDLYTVELAEGEQLTLFTRTPLDEGHVPLNNLDAELLVYGPDGLPFDDDQNSSDGRNPRITIEAEVPGTYVVQVRAEDGAGEYLLATSSDSLFGDFDSNGQVDIADFTIWADSNGQAVVPGTGADGDRDGWIDQQDFAVWKQNFGTNVNVTRQASVVVALADSTLGTRTFPAPGQVTDRDGQTDRIDTRREVWVDAVWEASRDHAPASPNTAERLAIRGNHREDPSPTIDAAFAEIELDSQLLHTRI